MTTISLKIKKRDKTIFKESNSKKKFKEKPPKKKRKERGRGGESQ